jgi:small subunit ribosomal protein S8
MNLLCNLISKLKNATCSNQRFVFLPKTLLCVKFLKLLLVQGMISNFCELPFSKTLKVTLKYNLGGVPCFKNIKIISTPANIKKVSYVHLTKLEQGTGVFVLSTNEGMLTSQDCLKRKIGGFILCYIN